VKQALIEMMPQRRGEKQAPQFAKSPPAADSLLEDQTTLKPPGLI
jgi:hypothetical protein